MSLLRRAQLILNDHWSSSLQPLSTCGFGRAGAVKKIYNVAKAQMLGVESMEQFDDKRQRYRGATMDRGEDGG